MPLDATAMPRTNTPATFAPVICNNFFAACEGICRPDLEGRPVVVLPDNDGCIIARPDAAKAPGVKPGKPCFKARNLNEFHRVEVFSCNHALYGDITRSVKNVPEIFFPAVRNDAIGGSFPDLSGVSNPVRRGQGIRLTAVTDGNSGLRRYHEVIVSAARG